MFEFRSAFETIRRFVGELERFAILSQPGTYDIGWMPIRKLKAYPESKKRHHAGTSTTVVHVTAVSGGFGVSKKRVEYWRKNPPANHPHLEPERLALFERYRDTPYHTIVNPYSGDIVFNRPLSQWSWHANAGNYGFGFAVDCYPKDGYTPKVIESACTGLSVHFARVATYSRNMVRFPVVPHRAFSKKRLADPGEWVWREVVLPTCKNWSRDKLNFMPDYELCKGGRPIPTSWDPHALFNAKGKRIV